MRVIAGEARGRSLEALPGTDVTRPTLSQVKEADVYKRQAHDRRRAAELQ